MAERLMLLTSVLGDRQADHGRETNAATHLCTRALQQVFREAFRVGKENGICEPLATLLTDAEVITKHIIPVRCQAPKACTRHRHDAT